MSDLSADIAGLLSLGTRIEQLEAERDALKAENEKVEAENDRLELIIFKQFKAVTDIEERIARAEAVPKVTRPDYAPSSTQNGLDGFDRGRAAVLTALKAEESEGE